MSGPEVVGRRSQAVCVERDGDDQGPGTSLEPLATLAAAVRRATAVFSVPGAVLEVRVGPGVSWQPPAPGRLG